MWITLNFSTWDVIAFVFGYDALRYAGIPLLAGALVLLAVPALRRRRSARIGAYGLIAIFALLVVAAFPVLEGIWWEWQRARAFAAATRHAEVAQTVGGITIPAGSTVHLDEQGVVAFGTLAAATVIDGLPLVGEFRLADGVEGNLAAPAKIHGIPCGPGRVVSRNETTSCVLGMDYDFSGHALAKDHLITIYRSPLNEPPMLELGTLAHAELLYDVEWPAGTMLGRVNASPDTMAHGPAPADHPIELCLPSELTVTIDEVVLHGFLSYTIDSGRRLISPVCDILPDNNVGDDGYVQVAQERYTWGERPGADAAWRWTDPVSQPPRR
jgi:hypothetical protein